MTPSSPELRAKSLLTLRVIWAALLLGQILFAVVVLILHQSPRESPTLPREITDMLFYINVFMLVVLVPVGYSVRNQIYKKNWVGSIISPTGYLQGNLVLFAICEAISIKGIAVSLLGAQVWPILLPPVGAMIMMVINFPTGRAMNEV